MFKGKHINCTSEETWQGQKGSLINYAACIKHVAEMKRMREACQTQYISALVPVFTFIHRGKT